MSIITETLITDIILATDSSPTTHLNRVVEIVLVEAFSSSSLTERISVSVEASDTAQDFVTEVVSDEILAADAVTPAVTPRSFITDTISASDQVQDILVEAISDIIIASDLTFESSTEIVYDSITIIDAIPGGQTYGDTVVDEILAQDALDGNILQAIADEIVATDSVAGTARVLETVADAAVVDDLIAARAFVLSIATDEIIATDLVITGGTFVDKPSDIIIATDKVYSTNPNALAWVVNTETGAPSFYTNFQFNSLASFAGMIFATGADGIYVLEGDTDNTTEIDSELKSGFEDFGTDRKKHLPWIYLGYTGGELEVDVETQEAGDIYTYSLEERDADAPRNNRFEPGKGLSDRYWRFTFRNVAGANFQINDISASISTSNRRI